MIQASKELFVMVTILFFYIDPYNIYYPEIKEIRLKFVNVRNNINFSKYLSELDFTDDGSARVECFVISNNKNNPVTNNNKFYLSVDGCQGKGIEINCDGIIWDYMGGRKMINAHKFTASFIKCYTENDVLTIAMSDHDIEPNNYIIITRFDEEGVSAEDSIGFQSNFLDYEHENYIQKISISKRLLKLSIVPTIVDNESISMVVIHLDFDTKNHAELINYLHRVFDGTRIPLAMITLDAANELINLPKCLNQDFQDEQDLQDVFHFYPANPIIK